MLNGTVIAAASTPRMAHASRQPVFWIIHCAAGMIKTVPIAIPVVAMDMARPRFLTNHLATGTRVSRLPPGPPPSPTPPETANSR